jgi:RNA polymerase sigma factor (sigma-70 family)
MTTATRMKAAAMPSTITGDETIRRQRTRVFDFIRRRVRTTEDAEDLVQDVFYQLAASDNADEPIEQLSAWLFTVAKNKVIDWYRKRKPTARLDFFSDDDDSVPHLAEVLYDPHTHPETLLDRTIFWSELEQALAELPDVQREAFIMHELQDKSYKEMATETGEALGTLLSRKHRATAKLRVRLQDSWDSTLRTTGDKYK